MFALLPPKMRGALSVARERRRIRKIMAGHRAFDSRYGVRTRNVSDQEAYSGLAPVSQENFELGMAAVDVRRNEFVFVDLGSGTGKAMLMASEYPFERIVGAEISPTFHAAAVDNIRRYNNPRQRCHAIESRRQDATDFEFPARPLVVYMYNPFPAEIVRRVLDRLEASLSELPRPCWILYINPIAASEINSRASFEPVASGRWFTVWKHHPHVRDQPVELM